MKSFFHPESVAVIGASPRKGGYNIIANLLNGFKGAVYPVNPNYGEIEGLPCFASVEQIPGPVELAIIFIPAPKVPDALEACARKGIKRVMIESAGFAEVGADGKAIQDRLKAVAEASNMRLWGPNCMGLVDVRGKNLFTFMSPRLYKDGLLEGKLSLIVQSGMLSAAFIADLMGRKKIGMGQVCSIGNKMDVDECDLLEYLLDDHDTDVVALYLESIRRGELFAKIAAKARKPIVALKGGRSSAGAKAAMSHTSSLSGNSRLLDSVLELSGVVLARDFFQMIDLAKTLAMTRLTKPAPRVAVLTFSGGAGILTCDLLENHGFELAGLSPDVVDRLADLFPSWMPVSNPVDMYPAIERHGRLATYDQAVPAALDDPQVDVVLLHYPVGVETDFIDLAGLKEKADRVNKPLLVWTLGLRDATEEFKELAYKLNVPCFDELSRMVECLAAAEKFSRVQRERNASPGAVRASDHVQPPPALASGDRVWDEYQSKRLLSKWNIPVVEERLAATAAEAEEAARALGYPVVLKGLVPGGVHKTEQGLVRLGITSNRDLETAFGELREKIRESNGRILAQRQVRIEYELIAGYLRDSQFGPCVMFGVGGILSELHRDVMFALAPLNRPEALKLIRSIRGKRLLEGFRGMAPLDLDRMADLLVNLGALGAAYPQIEQIDINPVAVAGGIPLAVDASVILKAD